MTEPTDSFPVMRCTSPTCWKKWLAKHHGDRDGVWLQIARKASGIASVTYAEAVEDALCHGWIDGQRKSLDENYFIQKFTPRRARSLWSKVNREKVAALIAAGRMHPAGHAEIDRAKNDGRWDAAYDPQSTSEVPADLAAGLARQPVAKAFFDALDSRNRYAILMRLQTAKKSETRDRRLALFLDMLARGEKIHP